MLHTTRGHNGSSALDATLLRALQSVGSRKSFCQVFVPEFGHHATHQASCADPSAGGGLN